MSHALIAARPVVLAAVFALSFVAVVDAIAADQRLSGGPAPRFAVPRLESTRKPVVRFTAKRRAPSKAAIQEAANRKKKNDEVILKLKTVLQTLSKAEHDYQGHRVSVMDEIGNAILHITPHKPGSMPENPALAYRSDAKGTGTTTTSQPRATSDEHMREALKMLKPIETHLNIIANTPQQVRAHASVQKAIDELKLVVGSR